MELVKNALRYCVLVCGVLAVVSATASADTNGIPYNSNFPNAEFPYAQAPDGCSGYDDPKEVRDTWGPVNFTDTCNAHDRCYYTLGSSSNSCNLEFARGLESACWDGLRKCFTLWGKEYCTPPEPTSYSACIVIAASYTAVVQAVSGGIHTTAQLRQAQYEAWLRSIGKL